MTGNRASDKTRIQIDDVPVTAESDLSLFCAFGEAGHQKIISVVVEVCIHLSLTTITNVTFSSRKGSICKRLQGSWDKSVLKCSARSPLKRRSLKEQPKESTEQPRGPGYIR